ncbi:MAG: AAA family ATPase [Saccharofermentans sp.]|nr:AAA family ATPase [Saccharofermentans sp.]
MGKDESTGMITGLDTQDIGQTVSGSVKAVRVFCPRTEKGFVSFLAEGSFAVAGTSAVDVVEGGIYEVSGKVTTWNGRPEIKLGSIKVVSVDSDRQALTASFLEDNLKGCGKAISTALAEQFEDDLLEALENEPERIADSVNGVSLDLAISFADQVTQEKEFFEKGLKLRVMGLSQSQLKRCIKYGYADIEKIEENPYMLFSRRIAGFETCDRIAGEKETEGVLTERLSAAFSSAVMRLHENTKSTYLLPDICRKETLKLLRSGPGPDITATVFEELFETAVTLANDNKETAVYRFENDKCAGCGINDEDARVSSYVYFKDEVTIKRKVTDMTNARTVKPSRSVSDGIFDRLALASGIILDDVQKEALYLCMYSKICVITGGPGTGKTTILGLLADYFKEKNITAVYAAPTGRAAKRLSESTGCIATTIHRLLGAVVKDDDTEEMFYEHTSDSPIDARVVIVDEMSMVDTDLFASLISSVAPDSSLILVGDPDQLPSVGCGNVLMDLLSCRSIPSVRLTSVHRHDEGGSIALGSRMILEGKAPEGNSSDFVVIKTDNDDEAVSRLTDIVKDLGESDWICLTPTRNESLVLGTVRLNKMIQELLTGEETNSIARGKDSHFSIGDRVMQTKNNYSLEWIDPVTGEVNRWVFNGEIGVVKDSDPILGTMVVEFDDGKRVTYTRKTMEDLELAYAVTVHKAQGCEFDTCIIVLGQMSPLLYQRRLLYTAVTRGKKKVILIDSDDCSAHFLKSRNTGKRNTSLGDLLHLTDIKRERGNA